VAATLGLALVLGDTLALTLALAVRDGLTGDRVTLGDSDGDTGDGVTDLDAARELERDGVPLRDTRVAVAVCVGVGDDTER
jgi:hypothetical protein